MAGIEDAFEKFVKKISDIEGKDTEDDSNIGFGKNVYAPQDGLFFSPVQKNQIPFGDILKSDQRLNPPIPTPTQRNLSSEERMRLEDNEYFMSQGKPQYVSPVVQGQGFNKRDLKDFTKQYLQSQTPLGGGIGYQGPEYGVMAIKPFVGPDRSALLQAYYNTDNEGSRIQAGLSPKEQRIDYTGNTGTTFSAGRNTYQGNPYYTFNVNKPFADGGVASMFRKRPGYAEGGNIIYKGDDDFFLNFQKGVGFVRGPNGWEFNGYIAPESNLPKGYSIKDAGRDEDGNIIKEIFKDPNSTGTSIPTTTEIPTVDPFSGQQVSAQDQTAFTQPQDIFPEQGIPSVMPEASTNLSSNQTVIPNNYELPTVSPDDSMNAYQPESTGPTINPALNLLGNYFGIGSLPEIQNFDMFSKAQQQSIQDAILRSVQPQDNLIQLGNVSPTNIPVSSYLSYFPEDKITQAMTQQNISSTGFGNIRSQTADQLRALTGDPSATARMSLGRFNVNVDPLKGTANIADTYDFSKYLPGKPMNINIPLPQEFTQQLINNPYYEQTLAKQDPTTYSQLQQQRSQQEASARVMPTRMAYGGRVSMSDGGLTTTIAPAKGPDSQGVESLFRRRYN